MGKPHDDGWASPVLRRDLHHYADNAQQFLADEPVNPWTARGRR
jgi:hypothetical protein